MEYTVENYSVVFTEEYVEENLPEFNLLKEMLEIKEPEEVTFTTGEDGDIEDYVRCTRLAILFEELPTIKEVVIECIEYRLVNWKGVKIVVLTFPFNVFFIKVADKDKFDKLTDKI